MLQAQLLSILLRRNFHASGMKKSLYYVNPKTFRRDFIEKPVEHAEKSRVLWERVFWFGFVPLIFACAVNAYLLEKEHAKHFKRREFKNYDHLYAHISKKYPWGDGTKSLFFNPKVNCLPTGYVDEE